MEEQFETFAQKRQKGTNTFFRIGCIALLLVIIGLEIAVIATKKAKTGANGKDKPGKTASSSNETGKPADKTPEPTPYVLINEKENTIETRFNPPAGYTRISVEKDSFGDYLRKYPLKKYGEQALLYNGLVSDEASKLGVFIQPDPLVWAQQCADTAIMLRAEYLYEQGRYNEICFEFVNGFECDFLNWAAGMRPVISGPNGNTVNWVDKRGTQGVAELDYSYENLLEYLKEIYVYANTDSLVQQFGKRSASEIQPGDIIVASQYELRIQAGEQGIDAPTLGHAMVVADVAENEAGERVFLLVEGTTPATEPCVVEDPKNPGQMWFKFDQNGTFVKSTSGIKWRDTWIYSFDITK